MKFTLFLAPCLNWCMSNFFNFILYMKHDYVTMYDAFMWNWSKNTLYDNAIFIVSCINEAIGDEIWWQVVQEKVSLGTRILHSPNCIGFINLAHSSRFGSHGKMKPIILGLIYARKNIWWITPLLVIIEAF